jgi:hypothetical protein
MRIGFEAWINPKHLSSKLRKLSLLGGDISCFTLERLLSCLPQLKSLLYLRKDPTVLVTQEPGYFIEGYGHALASSRRTLEELALLNPHEGCGFPDCTVLPSLDAFTAMKRLVVSASMFLGARVCPIYPRHILDPSDLDYRAQRPMKEFASLLPPSLEFLAVVVTELQLQHIQGLRSRVLKSIIADGARLCKLDHIMFVKHVPFGTPPRCILPPGRSTGVTDDQAAVERDELDALCKLFRDRGVSLSLGVGDVNDAFPEGLPMGSDYEIRYEGGIAP